MKIIAADVGGTKTRLICADAEKPCTVLYEARYQCDDFDSFEPLLQTFIKDCGAAGVKLDAGGVSTLTLALPGLVSETSARLTNLPWVINKQSLKDAFGIKNVHFMNDFQASAFGTVQLQDNDRVILNRGQSNPDGPKINSTRVAVGAGTGLGVAWAQDEADCEATAGAQIKACAHDTEGGHIDFAPIDTTQIALLQYLQQRFGHVSYERILSGDGLVSLYRFCSGDEKSDINAQWVNLQAENNAAADTALTLFVQIYGAYIGNIALLFKPYGGIFITGGIAAKILKKMQSQEFIDAYLNKGRMRVLVEQIAVYLVTNERVGVLGAMSEAIKMQQRLPAQSPQPPPIKQQSIQQV